MPHCSCSVYRIRMSGGRRVAGDDILLCAKDRTQECAGLHNHLLRGRLTVRHGV